MRKPLPMDEQKKSVIWQEWERGTPMSNIARVIEKPPAMAEENRRLNRIYAEMSMQNDLLKEALGKRVKAVSEARDGRGSCCR